MAKFVENYMWIMENDGFNSPPTPPHEVIQLAGSSLRSNISSNLILVTLKILGESVIGTLND